LHGNALAIHVVKTGIRRPTSVIDSAVRLFPEHQPRLVFADALDVGPAVILTALTQIWQVLVDGVGMDIDDAGGGGSVSVDRSWLRTTRWAGGSSEASYCVCIIQDVHP